MKKLASVVAAVTVAPMLFASAPAYADSPGQLSNAPTNYEVKNVTKNGTYAQSTSAACGETVRYSVLIANSDFGLLKDVRVKTSLSSGGTNVSATNAEGNTTSVSGDVNVSTNGTLDYVEGSTMRYDQNGAKATTKLADGITDGGVNAGELKGSSQMFVQFDAKVTCDTPPAPGKIKVCELKTKKIVVIDEKSFDSSKYTKDLSKCEATPETPGTPGTPTTPETPTELVKTGAGQVAAIFAAAAAFGAIAYNVVLRRSNAR